jgi:hypothetical protein
MKSSLSILVSAIALASLAACGGGSGDDSTSQPAAAKVAITSANQNQVVRASVNAGLSVSLAQGSVGGGVSPAGVADRSHALAAVMERAVSAARASRKGIASASAHPTASTSSTQACTGGGTMTITLDDRDGNQQISNGDVITASFSQCKDTATSTINGAIAVTLTGTPTATQFAASANFQNIVVTDNGVTATIAGTVAVSETDTATDIVTTLSVGSSGLTASTASTAYTDAVSFASGFVITTDEASSGSVSVSLAGTMSAQSVGGSITIATPQPLVEASSDTYPSSGQVILTGASGSAVRATVLDNTQVKIELDANGDGTYESTSIVTWNALIA